MQAAAEGVDAMTTLDLANELLEWATREFGSIAKLPDERGLRLLEEAVESAQAMGVSKTQALSVVARCYGRPPGDPVKELGQVGGCLLTACAVMGCDAQLAWEAEAKRLMSLPTGHFRDRHATKVASGIAREANPR